MSDAARLLDVLRDAAMRGDDLVAALRACGLPGADRAAERLATGATLPQAVTGLIPARMAAMLAGSTPPLATVTALLADEAWRDGERRRLVLDHLAYPLASCAMVAVLMTVVHHVTPAGPWYGSLLSAAWAVPPALVALVVMIAPWTPRRWRLPGSGWAAQLDLAALWARGALAVRWRLTEAQALRLLGADLQPLSDVLGAPGAEAHCRMLADWHRRAAWRSLIFTAFVTAALILMAGGGLVLGTARMWMATPM